MRCLKCVVHLDGGGEGTCRMSENAVVKWRDVNVRVGRDRTDETELAKREMVYMCVLHWPHLGRRRLCGRRGVGGWVRVGRSDGAHEDRAAADGDVDAVVDLHTVADTVANRET